MKCFKFFYLLSINRIFCNVNDSEVEELEEFCDVLIEYFVM